MLRAARQSLATRRGLLWLTWYGGAAAVGIGFIASFDGRWAVTAVLLPVGALLLWLTGAWVRPGGADAYARRVLRVFGDWTAYTSSLDGRYEHRLGKFERRLAALTPPDELRADHERLVALFAEPVAAWTDGDTPSAERLRRELTARVAAQELLDSIRARAPQSDYVTELDRIRAAQREEYAVAAADADRAASDAARRLEGITPPPAAADDHAALVAALYDLHAANVRLRAARDAVDADGAGAALEAWEEATRRVQDHAQRIAERAA
jgi:hypothetical protein